MSEEKKSIIEKIKAFKEGFKKMVSEAAEMPTANPMGMADKTTIEQMKRLAEKNKGR